MTLAGRMYVLDIERVYFVRASSDRRNLRRAQQLSLKGDTGPFRLGAGATPTSTIVYSALTALGAPNPYKPRNDSFVRGGYKGCQTRAGLFGLIPVAARTIRRCDASYLDEHVCSCHVSCCALCRRATFSWFVIVGRAVHPPELAGDRRWRTCERSWIRVRRAAIEDL
jgi:hypothetical protein